MDRWSYVFLVGLICFVSGSLAALPDTLRTYHILEGDNLLVRCNVTLDNDTYVYWLKNDSRKVYRQNGTDLAIFDIRRDYSGEYVCHLVNTSAVNSSVTGVNVTAIKVDVIYPTEINFFSLSPTVLKENDTFLITCDVQGNPDPTWEMRNNDTMETFIRATAHASATIGPNVARCDSAGFWVCTGYNRLNKHENITKGEKLTVYCPPKPSDNQEYKVRAMVGRRATFTMQIYTIPRPTYVWTRNGKETRGVQTDDDQYTQLEINDIDISDYGSYQLTMSNEYGRYNATYELQAIGSPQKPTHMYFSEVRDTSVKLHWTSGYDMGTLQHFVIARFYGFNAYTTLGSPIYDNSTNHGVDNKWEYTLTGLDVDTKYNLSVIAINEDKYVSDIPKPFMVFRTNAAPDDWPFVRSLSTGTIVGISFGALLGLLALLAVLMYIFKWRKMKTSYEKH